MVFRISQKDTQTLGEEEKGEKGERKREPSVCARGERGAEGHCFHLHTRFPLFFFFFRSTRWCLKNSEYVRRRRKSTQLRMVQKRKEKQSRGSFREKEQQDCKSNGQVASAGVNSHVSKTQVLSRLHVHLAVCMCVCPFSSSLPLTQKASL